MPNDRLMLIASMVLQSAVSLTFGLAFLGLWKGFHRPAAGRWAVAWLVYSVGVVFAALIIGIDLRPILSPLRLAVLGQPLLIGVMLFRAGTDALVGRLKPRRYLLAGATIFLFFVAVREVDGRHLVAMDPSVAGYILPRMTMGVLYVWAAWPLRRLARRRWAEGYALMAGAMVCLSIRMFVSAGYQLMQIGRSANVPLENLWLAIAQIAFLIVFGVATALVLVEGEHRAAVLAAQTIQETSDALKASEVRFRFVVEHSSDVQAVVGADHRIRYLAPSCERLIGFPPSEFEGRPLMDLIHADDHANVEQALAGMHADPSARRPPTPVRIQSKTGEWLPFDVTGKRVPQENPTGAALILSIRDMGVQRQLEAALQQSSRMAGSVSHDFNNMLSVITAGLEFAMANLAEDHPARQDLLLVREAASRGEALTRQLLTFARQRPPATERFDVNARLASLERVIKMAAGGGVKVRIAGSGQALCVRADTSQFDQVIMNLAINARDAMSSRGSLTMVAMADADAARIIVEDTGAGIPAELIDRIFEPFFTTKAEGKGSGLGLANVYAFARQAGGSLTVESTQGVGTRFSLSLPLAV